jgi:two-component system, chemotaxis family, chemotaxis protein CheY
MRVIIADDSAVMRRIVMRTLRQAGYADCDVTEAVDGAELVALVRADEPDLVLSDWNMPNMTGINALIMLRAEGCNVPFGFVTSEGSELMREQAAAAGAAFLVAKPFTAEAMQEAMAAVV